MFKCSGCGVCCHHVDKAAEALKDNPLLQFPYEWDESGKCNKLDKNNRCSVYEDRPLMCNIDKAIEVFGLDKEAFYALNTKACNDLMDAEKVDLHYRL